MVTGTRRITGTVICVSVAFICFGWWWFRKPDPLTYFQSSVVADLSVTLADGSPLPTEIGMDDKFVILIRFRSTGQLPELQDSAYFFVLNEKQHYSDKPDIIEVYRQHPVGEGTIVSFMDIVKGASVNVAPSPPAHGAPYQQWCAWFESKAFEHHKQAGVPLELDLWMYPKRDKAAKTPPVGIGIVRHLFQLRK
ncbi:MAG: hypothetical protein H7062_04785 [Candidatus Saccharimonas sp.]|nr:hypothetical protein [Planctomycetaceae bacterium]